MQPPSLNPDSLQMKQMKRVKLLELEILFGKQESVF